MFIVLNFVYLYTIWDMEEKKRKFDIQHHHRYFIKRKNK